MKSLIVKYLNSEISKICPGETYEFLFSNWRNLEINALEKEKINSLSMFFHFMLNDDAINFLDKSYKTLEDNWENINKYNKIELGLSKNECIFWFSIFALKSFSNFSPLYKEDFGDYRNSDKCLDVFSSLIRKYIIFNNLTYKGVKETRGYSFKIIYVLITNGLILEKDRINIDSSHRFLIKFWKINITKNINSIYENFNFSYFKYDIISFNDKLYTKGVYFWNIYDVYSKNFESDAFYEITNKEYISLIKCTKTFIDKEAINSIKQIMETDINIYKNMDLEEISNQIHDISEKRNWNIYTDEKIKELRKMYSKKLEDLSITSFLNIDFRDGERIYFPTFFDFRGRKYYFSNIGPTSSKITRFVLFYGYYEKTDFNNTVEIEEILEWKEEIISFCKNYNIHYDDVYLESIFWLLIGIGKFGIKKKDVFIKTEIILYSAYNIIKNIDSYKFKLIEKIEINHYINILKSLNQEKIKKRIVIKDGTASVYQISMILLGPKNQKSLSYVNLYNSNEWVDTYSLISNKFIEHYLQKKKNATNLYDDLKNIMQRDITKNALMTIPYSVGFTNCFEKFKEILKEKHPEILIDIKLETMFRDFYNFAKNKIEKSILYEKTSKSYVKNIIEEFKDKRCLLRDTNVGKTDLGYKKLENKPIDIKTTVNVEGKKIKKRITKQVKIISKAINIQKTKTALGPNTRHLYEAHILQLTELRLGRSIISIHDAELIDFNSCSKLILIKNEIFRELIKTKYKIKSIYIYI